MEFGAGTAVVFHKHGVAHRHDVVGLVDNTLEIKREVAKMGLVAAINDQNEHGAQEKRTNYSHQILRD